MRRIFPPRKVRRDPMEPEFFGSAEERELEKIRKGPFLAQGMKVLNLCGKAYRMRLPVVTPLPPLRYKWSGIRHCTLPKGHKGACGRA
jgi:hypothetical protein